MHTVSILAHTVSVPLLISDTRRYCPQVSTFPWESIFCVVTFVLYILTYIDFEAVAMKQHCTHVCQLLSTWQGIKHRKRGKVCVPREAIDEQGSLWLKQIRRGKERWAGGVGRGRGEGEASSIPSVAVDFCCL